MDVRLRRGGKNKLSVWPAITKESAKLAQLKEEKKKKKKGIALIAPKNGGEDSRAVNRTWGRETFVFFFFCLKRES